MHHSDNLDYQTTDYAYIRPTVLKIVKFTIRLDVLRVQEIYFWGNGVGKLNYPQDGRH